jgi:hypothetical protein
MTYILTSNVLQKSICNFMTAVNAQDKKEFRGNDETGMILLGCPHGMVESCVDMYFGERCVASGLRQSIIIGILTNIPRRFAYSDFAFARALDTRSLEDIPVVLSYNCVCSYSVNAQSRFTTHLPRHALTVARTIFTIDSLHVHDHQDRCIYLYSTYYKEGVGHFHAVQVEQFWSENNQIGPQTRQMNLGNRHDKITQSCADSNLKKVTKIGTSTLYSVYYRTD